MSEWRPWRPFSRIPLPAHSEQAQDEERMMDVHAFMDSMAAKSTPSGTRVSPDTAIRGTVAVYACVALLAETTGSLPCLTYKRADDRNRERVQETPLRWPGTLARSLHQSPNPEMTAPEYWEMVVGHLCTWGNSFSYIVRDMYGRPQELWPLRPDKIEITVDDATMTSRRWYSYLLPNGEKRGLQRHDVLHIMDLSSDGIMGMSPISVARNAVGIEQAAGDYAGRFFGNSAVPGGILTSDKSLNPEAVAHLKEQWQSLHSGLNNAQRVAVLHSGISWQSIGLPPKDAQFIELRRFEVEEIARLYRIPLHLVGDTTANTSWGTGIEQMGIGFVVYTLQPRLHRIAAALNRDLGDPAAGSTLLDEDIYAEFEVNALLRGDMAARSTFYQSGIQNGWMTPEDVRALENLPHLAGLDRPFMPLNMAPIGSDGMPKVPEPPPAPEPQPPTEPVPPAPAEEPVAPDATPAPKPSAAKAARAAYEQCLREGNQ